jgi:hypothetical protein
VQVLVLGFDEPDFDGTALAELTRLRDAGVVRLVDILVVRRADDGALETVEGRLDGHGRLASALLGGGDSDTADDADGRTWSLADAVPEQGVAVVALIEHVWAGPLAAALHSAGGTLLEETWLSEGDRRLLASLEA